MWRLEKFHGLPSASQQTRKASGVIQPKSKGPQIRKAAGVSLIPSLRARTFLAVRQLRLCTSTAGGRRFDPWLGCMMWPQKEKKVQCSSCSSEKKPNRALLCLFIPFRPSVDWMMPACTGEDKLFFFFFQLEANYFTILQWFLSYIDKNQPWFYMYSPSRSPLPPPSPPNPSGSSQCTRSEHLSHASNLGW